MKHRIQALYSYIPLGMALMLVVFLLTDSSTALAAGFNSDIGLKAGDGSFQNNLTSITNGMFAVARIISIIMIALAGLMIAFNVESANKTTWNIILGIGLALNFGTVLMSAYGGYVGMGGDQAAFEYKMHVDADKNSKWYDFRGCCHYAGCRETAYRIDGHLSFHQNLVGSYQRRQDEIPCSDALRDGTLSFPYTELVWAWNRHHG